MTTLETIAEEIISDHEKLIPGSKDLSREDVYDYFEADSDKLLVNLEAILVKKGFTVS